MYYYNVEFILGNMKILLLSVYFSFHLIKLLSSEILIHSNHVGSRGPAAFFYLLLDKY